MNGSLVLRQRSYVRIGVMALSALFAACVALCMALPAQAQAASYTLGKTVTATETPGTNLVYTFTVGSTGADVNISLKMNRLYESQYDGNYDTYDLAVYARLQNSSGSYVWSGSVAKPGAKTSKSKLFLSPGSYKMTFYGNTIYGISQQVPQEFTFSISKVAQKLTLTSKKGKFTVGSTVDMPAGTSKTVKCFKYSGSYNYASKNVKIAKNTKAKVAAAKVAVNSDGTGSLTITPKKLGKTVVSIKLAGGNTVKYTVYVTKKTIYVAKGSSAKIGKLTGVGKVKFKSSKSSVAKVTTKSTGKFVAKKQGKAKVYAKKSGITYTCVVVVTDYDKLASIARKEIRENVPDPNSIHVNKAYRGMSNKTTVGGSVPIVWVDYTYSNESGGSSRDRVLFVFSDTFNVLEWHGLPESYITSKKKAIKI